MVQHHKNESVLVALRAATVAVLTGVSLSAMSVKPVWLPIGVGALVGVVALASTELAVLIALVALSIPVITVSPVVGFTMLVVSVASVRYLGASHAKGYIALGVALAGAFLGPVWASAALAGYLLGAGEGALAAALACLLVEVVGVALGRPAIGATVSGGTAHALVAFAHLPSNLLSAAWPSKVFATLNASELTAAVSAFAKLMRPLLLLGQLCTWALAGGVAGAIGKVAQRKRSVALGIASVSVGVVIAAAGQAMLLAAFKLPVPARAIGYSFLTSLVVAVAFVALWELVFAPAPVVPPARPRSMSMATEDADVDELLRLIATAEDKLATQHTSTQVVMITDMKSFSRMTEEDGSVATAKAIQRHRDLLLPIVRSHHGAGKSTGGDGLVSAFASPIDALAAAGEMQRALAEHNAAHPNEREIWVRTGLAAGEVVLDNGGRPFIGAGLNLAARVMNLADGGQIFATADVARSASAANLRTHSFGEFALKNIAMPTEIVEVLWADGQLPQDPHDSGAAQPHDGND